MNSLYYHRFDYKGLKILIMKNIMRNGPESQVIPEHDNLEKVVVSFEK